MSEPIYGPQTELILRMIAQCDSLSDEQLESMAEAYLYRGPYSDTTPWNAALAVSQERMEQAAKAGADLKRSLEMAGFGRDPETFRIAQWAADETGLAVATRDLVGTEGYFLWDYDKLMYPWRVGVGDPE